VTTARRVKQGVNDKKNDRKRPKMRTGDPHHIPWYSCLLVFCVWVVFEVKFFFLSGGRCPSTSLLLSGVFLGGEYDTRINKS
jgi:1,4-dihydroxy-2-naphthoate octaprenyltransferase